MEENIMERDFKGIWIPASVYCDTRLNALEKIIFAEIDSLDIEPNGCFASNKYLSEFCQCSETKVSLAISKLIKYNYISVENFNGRQRILKSCLLKTESIKKIKGSLSKNERQDIKNCKAESQNVKDINTIESIKENKQEDNNTSKEKTNKKKSSSANSDAIISETIQSSDFSEDVKNALTDFVQNRKELKNPVTSLGIKRLLSKLHSLSSDEAEQIEIINQSIERGYSGLFPVHQGTAQGYSTKNNSFISREKQIEMLNRLTESDINNYCREKNYSHVSASEFLGNYRKRNWMVGNSVITDWKSAVDEWEARELKRIKDKEDEEYKIYHRSYMTRCLNDKL